MSQHQTDIIIVCALPKERDAVLRYIGPTESIAIGQRKYKLANIAGGEGEQLKVVVRTLPGMGSVQAGIATTQAILDWEPYYIILSGIAGGHKASDRRLGDLVIAQQIVGYELGKLQAGIMRRRFQVLRPAFDLMQAAYRTETTDWSRRIQVPRPEPPSGQPPRVHYGVVASGEKVVADSHLMAELASSWSRLVAIEMEAYGTALAANQASNPPGVLMVKSLCDWADESKNDHWQEYAADAAASFTISLLGAVKVHRFNRPCPAENSTIEAAAHCDATAISCFRACFQRLAFEVPAENGSSVDDFDQAIQDTITALTTGALIDRVTCCVPRQGPAISDLSSNQNVTDMGNIVRNLQNLRNEYRMATQSGDLDTFMYKRIQILDSFNAIAQRAGLPPLTLILAQDPSFTVDYVYPRSEPVGVECTAHISPTSPDLAGEGLDAEGGSKTTDFA
jgi:nucleoside phosphorylase